VATQGTSGSRPWRRLAALAVIIAIMLISVTGTDTFHPGQWQHQFKVGLGLDLSSGTEVMLQAQTPTGHPPPPAEMNQAASILQARVNGTGTTGAQVQRQGGDLINVSVPGAGSQRVIDLLSTPAQMSFRQVLLFQPYGTPATTAAAPGYFGNAGLVSSAAKTLFGKLTCTPGQNGTVNDKWKATAGYTPQQAQWDDPASQVVSCDAAGNKYALDAAVFKGTDVASENAALLPGSSAWAVNLTLKDPAVNAFGALTAKQYRDYLPQAGTDENDAVLDQTALVLDGDVVTAPQTRSVLATGQFAISGPDSAPFTQQQASQLVNELKYGALPLSFTRLSSNSISAQLGARSLQAGLLAGGIGLGLVAAYSFVYYRGLGAVSVSSLIIAALLSYLAVALLSRYRDFTLSLPGIAGLIVAIGITADSFVVFFERIRDQMRGGQTLRAAVEHGWQRARRTILVSDTVSVLAAVVLYQFAVGDVQGFAFSLGLTTLIDVVVVVSFTKPILTVLAGTKFFGGGHRWSGLDPARLGARTPWRSSA
jgi:preprotein translocase subunit SecD